MPQHLGQYIAVALANKSVWLTSAAWWPFFLLFYTTFILVQDPWYKGTFKKSWPFRPFFDWVRVIVAFDQQQRACHSRNLTLWRKELLAGGAVVFEGLHICYHCCWYVLKRYKAIRTIPALTLNSFRERWVPAAVYMRDLQLHYYT